MTAPTLSNYTPDMKKNNTLSKILEDPACVEALDAEDTANLELEEMKEFLDIEGDIISTADYYTDLRIRQAHNKWLDAKDATVSLIKAFLSTL